MAASVAFSTVVVVDDKVVVEAAAAIRAVLLDVDTTCDSRAVMKISQHVEISPSNGLIFHKLNWFNFVVKKSNGKYTFAFSDVVNSRLAARKNVKYFCFQFGLNNSKTT